MVSGSFVYANQAKPIAASPSTMSLVGAFLEGGLVGLGRHISIGPMQPGTRLASNGFTLSLSGILVGKAHPIFVRTCPRLHCRFRIVESGGVGPVPKE